MKEKIWNMLARWLFNQRFCLDQQKLRYKVFIRSRAMNAEMNHLNPYAQKAVEEMIEKNKNFPLLSSYAPVRNPKVYKQRKKKHSNPYTLCPNAEAEEIRRFLTDDFD